LSRSLPAQKRRCFQNPITLLYEKENYKTSNPKTGKKREQTNQSLLGWIFAAGFLTAILGTQKAGEEHFPGKGALASFWVLLLRDFFPYLLS